MNRLIVPGEAYPLMGDVVSTAGSNLVTVTGLQSVPLKSVFLSGGEIIQYDVNATTWVPLKIACIQVNNITVSLDYDIQVNKNDLLVKVNGAGAAP